MKIVYFSVRLCWSYFVLNLN